MHREEFCLDSFNLVYENHKSSTMHHVHNLDLSSFSKICSTVAVTYFLINQDRFQKYVWQYARMKLRNS